MRIVFFGSPDFALPSLEALVAGGHDLALVVSQPAKPVGRSAEPLDPPVARRAKELGLAAFQPPTLKDDAAFARLAGVGADLFVVVAYGKILAQRVLDLPRLGCVNVHGSVLPRWRGASRWRVSRHWCSNARPRTVRTPAAATRKSFTPGFTTRPVA